MDHPEPKKGPVDLSGLIPSDTAEIEMLVPGTNKPTGWKITLAGPSHPKSVALSEDAARRSLHRQNLIDQARINGKKWKGDNDTPEESRREFIESVVARIISWTPVSLGGKDYEFSPEVAIDLFMRPEVGGYFVQVFDYLSGESAFMPASATR